MMRCFNKKAQSTLEYAIIIAVVVGTLLAIQVYVKRGIEGRARSSVDNIGDQFSAGDTTSKYTTEETTSVTKEDLGTDGTFGGAVDKGVSKTEITTAPTTTRTATGSDAEKINTDLKKENLFNEQGTLFDK